MRNIKVIISVKLNGKTPDETEYQLADLKTEREGESVTRNQLSTLTFIYFFHLNHIQSGPVVIKTLFRK